MEFSNEDVPALNQQEEGPPPFPRLWVGYALGLVTVFAEIVAVSLHPEIAREPLYVPPLYLFLPSFISMVYWLVCVYEYHALLSHVTGKNYPISPARAAWFHLIPIYGFYWAFKWPREFSRFVNSRLPSPLMRPDKTGLCVFVAFVVFLLLDRGLGMILLFLVASNLTACLRTALAARPAPANEFPS
jgi:hypothetical protein